MKLYFDKLYDKGQESFYKLVDKKLKLKEKMFIITANPETFIHAKNNSDIDKMLLDSDTTLIPDGIGIVKSAKFVDKKIKNRITGVDLAKHLLEVCNKEKYNLALLGATEEVIEKMQEIILKDYSNINIVKKENGYIKDKDAFFSDIAKLDVDVCLVALGIPAQEKLIYKHLSKFKKGIFVGVGGSFDVLSGSKKRAPKIFQKLNLEWLYRIIKEPKRIKRFYQNNIKFLFKMVGYKVDKKTFLYVLLSLFYLLIAFINQFYLNNYNIKGYFNINSIIFTAFWIYILVMIKYLLPNKIGKYITLFIQCFLIIITITNFFYIKYFESIFTWKDLILSGEGFSFISSIFPLISFKLVLTIIALVLLTIVTFKLSKEKKKVFDSKKGIIMFLVLTLIMLSGYIFNKVSLRVQNDNETKYNSIRASEMLDDKKIIYTDWNNSKSNLSVSGIYEYLVRDLLRTIFTNDNPLAAKKYVDEYFKTHSNAEKINSKYSGIFEGKNLILVMMESVDDWQVNSKSAPTITMMKENGIDFINHHSLHYVTGKTAQSEFMANTGLYPKFNDIIPHYAYVDNDFEYSLPKLFKKKGYTVNAFHRTLGHIYNRENMMLSLGYEHYYNIYSLQLKEEEYDLDRYYAIKGYDLFIQDNEKKPFMDFYLTFSNHSPYTLEKKECKDHYDKMKQLFPNEKNEQKLCGYAQMYETDLFFTELLGRLKKDNILNNTVIIAFSDHPNGYFLSEEENSKNNYTEMFIYNPKIKHEKISKLTNTINILPMINTLFNLNSPYYMASYDPLTSDESYLIFSDYTYYDGERYNKLNNDQLSQINMSKNILISDYYKI